jgi:hypothetical protein
VRAHIEAENSPLFQRGEIRVEKNLMISREKYEGGYGWEKRGNEGTKSLLNIPPIYN